MTLTGKSIGVFIAAVLACISCGSEQPGDIGSTSQAVATKRSIGEFVAAQGDYCLLPALWGATTCDEIGTVEQDGCCLFVSPIANFMGWYAPDGTMASVDYAGLANAWIEDASGGAQSFGTSYKGSVTERALKGGLAEYHVILHTNNALAWVPTGGDWNNPTIFGEKAPDVLAGASPVLGSSHLEVVYTDVPGAPLADLIKLMVDPEPAQATTVLKFNCSIKGTLADGTPATLQVTQVGLLASPGQGKGVADGFPAEHVKLHVH